MASHLGAVALTASDCVTPRSRIGPQGPQVVGFSFGPGSDAGTFTLVAANGDRVTGAYQGVLAPASATAPLFAVQGHYAITGGTGRFVGATGEGDVLGQLLIDDNPQHRTASGTIEMVGTIAY